MECTHNVLKCVNCVFYCQICGARVDMPKSAEKATGATEAVTEPPKKRRTKKEAKA